MNSKKNIVLLFLLALFIPSFFIHAEIVPNNSSKVTVSGRQLIVEKRLPDGSLAQPVAYKIKGITWSAGSKCYTFFDWEGGEYNLLSWKRERYSYYNKKDLPIMKSMNINTVRVYLDFGSKPEIYKAILDECYNNEIMVIMAVANSKKIDLDTENYLEVVRLYKDHPAILMWCLGNEWNFNSYYTQPAIPLQELVTLTNNAASKIKTIDSNHPVSACLGDDFYNMEFIVKNCTNVDTWGLNIYRGDSFGGIFAQWQAITNKPFYFSEFGIDSFSTTYFEKTNGEPSIAYNCKGAEDEKTQALYFSALWQEIATHLSAIDSKQVCLGGCLHEFNDEIWKVGCYHAGLGGIYYPPHNREDYKYYNMEGFVSWSFPDRVMNEEYFGVVDSIRTRKKLVCSDIENCYRE